MNTNNYNIKIDAYANFKNEIIKSARRICGESSPYERQEAIINIVANAALLFFNIGRLQDEHLRNVTYDEIEKSLFKILE